MKARRQARLRLTVVALVAALGAAAWPGDVAAQQERGSLTGTVVDGNSLRPLSGVQVFVPGTSLGSITTAAGRFLIPNVPPGEMRLRAQIVGHATGEQTVRVVAGEATQVRFELAEQALALDEIVVTGAAGQARRREVGNTISQINTAEVLANVVDVDNLLQAKATGLTVLQGTGMAGAGSQIRLRGNVSVTQSNQPLIYIDGVRARSDGYPLNNPPTGFVGRGGNVQASPLNDINPADIERIEIIKGAAATTLYGTEAAAGVIQIFTKRGVSGRPTWTASIDQGFNRMMPFGIKGEPTATGARPEYMFIDPFLRNGHIQRYSLAVSGGGQDLQYFISGTFDDMKGVLPNDWEEKVSIRGNFTMSPLSGLQLQWNTAYTNHDISNTPSGNNAHGLTLNAYRRNRNYFQSEELDSLRQFLDYEIFTYNDRFMTGVTATYSPRAGFTHRITAGYDMAGSELRQVRPFHFLQLGGLMSNQRWSNAGLTVDYLSSLALRLNDDLRTTVAWGAQSIANDERSVSGYAERFPGPGVPTLSSGATRLSFEERIRVITAGVFGQVLFDLKDRYFLTLGVRVDGNSAFGSDFGLAPYPKVSVSHVISDEAFWPENLGQMKLRAAYGQAGRAPGAFDAVRTWNPVGWGANPAFRPLNVGNPVLGPERTAELEGGFDASLFGNRLSVEFTGYRQTTTDALFNVRQVPSLGFLGSQLENVGKLQNQGIELGVTATLIRMPGLEFDLGTNISTTNSKVLDLGGAPEFSLGDFAWVIEGQPAGVIRHHKLMNPDEVADPVIERDFVYGPNSPTLTVSVMPALRLPRGIQISARGEYQGGHYMYDGASLNALNRGVLWPTCFDAYPKIDAGRLNELTARERMQCIQANARSEWFIYPADFFKMRELAVRMPLPVELPGTRTSTLTLSARNFYTWKNKDFPIFDPEVVRFGFSQGASGTFGSTAGIRSIWEHVPPAATFIASLRVVF